MTRLLSHLLGHTALTLALLPLAAMAQDSEERVIELGAVTLEGSQGVGPVAKAGNPPTTTGSKTALRLTEIPQSISVIGAEEIADANAIKIDNLLAYSAGIQAAPYGYDSDTNWFFIRGFNATQTGAFLDGLPSYAYGFGGFYVDPLQLERIEVLRGPASALYGAANPGGLVNMVSKRPNGLSGGSDAVILDETGRVALQTDRQGVLASGLQWRLLAKAARTDDEGVFDDGHSLLLAPSLRYIAEGGTEFYLGLAYTRVDEDHVGGGWLPYTGTVERASFGYIDRDFNSGEPDYDSYTREQLTISGEISHRFDNGWRLVNNSRLGWSEVEESQVYAYGYSGYALAPADSDNTLARIYFQHRSKTFTALNDLRLENEVSLGGLRHRFMAGIDAKWFRLDQVQGSVAWPEAATGLSASSPVYGASQPDTTPYADNIIRQSQYGFYLQDQVSWGRGWSATLNLRHDLAQTSVSNDRSLATTGSKREDEKTTWRLGLMKELTPGLVAYASASSYFSPNVVTTSEGNAVGPETGTQREIGLKWSPNSASLIMLSVFDIDRSNISQSLWNGAAYDYYQIGEVNSRGIELEARYDLGNGLRVSGSLTRMDIEITNDVDTAIIGKIPYATIENMASVRVDYELPAFPGLTLSGGLRYLGSSWADNANTLKVPSATLVDAGISYDFAENWNGNLVVSNLADKRYVSACQTAYTCYYGEGRRVSLTIARRF